MANAALMIEARTIEEGSGTAAMLEVKKNLPDSESSVLLEFQVAERMRSCQLRLLYWPSERRLSWNRSAKESAPVEFQV